MAELVDAPDLKSGGRNGRDGSSPSGSTKENRFRISSEVESLTVNQVVAGSTPAFGAKIKEGDIAQVVERWLCKPKVEASIASISSLESN